MWGKGAILKKKRGNKNVQNIIICSEIIIFAAFFKITKKIMKSWNLPYYLNLKVLFRVRKIHTVQTNFGNYCVAKI